MINRTTKLRWRRRVRQSRVAVEDFGQQTEESLEKHFFKRLTRLYTVRRFMSAWLLLICFLITGLIIQTRALSSYYKSPQPVAGGSYTEGIIGSFTNANPLYASGSVDRAAARLVFSGLLTHDQNNQLVGELATGWEVDQTELIYTVRLRKDVKWHDGKPFTAADVVFTYKTIQNPDAKSPLQSSWAGITLEQPDDYTVVFKLPNTLSAFPYAMTNGIVPKHRLENIPVSQLRSTRFNTVEPIGTGAFKWGAIQVEGNSAETRQELIGLEANENYFKGAPKLQRFVIRTFRTEEQMLASFEERDVDAMAGLTTLQDTIKDLPDVKDYNVPLTGEVMVFFNNSIPVLQDVKVRQALVMAADTKTIVRGLDHAVISANSPLLKKHIGYDKSIVQLPFNVAEANAILDGAGWSGRDADGIRIKGEQRLSFRLFSQANAEYAYVTQQLQKLWRDVGAEVKVELPEDALFQETVAGHGYDALLYGISLGNDPDVFAYWHSSQAAPTAASRLNFSEYKSPITDRALEAGRTRSDPTLRAAKYKPFLEAWRNDAPALALYQPRFLYVTQGQLHGFDATLMNNAADRYNQVEGWMVREKPAIKP